MTAYIVGVDHWLQQYDLSSTPGKAQEAEAGIKAKFYAYLEELIRSRGIVFVGEECKQGEKTIPRELARENGCDYGEIDMPMDVRRERGIPENYEKLSTEVRDKGYSAREDYMVERIGCLPARPGPKLVVCGALHIPGLQERLAALGYNVLTMDAREADWYDTILAKFMRGEI